MRKILTKEELSVREKKRNRILTIIMLLILVVSSASYAFLSITPNQETQGTSSGKIQNYGNQWVVIWGGNQHVFSSSPESAFNATTLNFIPDINKYFGKPLYIDSKSEAIYSEISTNLGVYSERANRACYGECNDSNLPEKDCTQNLIVYTPANNNSIYQEDNCIFIQGDIRAVDAFLYREIGVA